MSETALLNIPYIMAAQAQKHVTHNEALRILDALVHLAVEDRDRSDPPLDPAEGQRHALGEAPTGAFAGQAGQIAAFQDGAWTFHMPQEGWLVWDKAQTALFVFDDGGWTPVSADMDSLPYLGINAAADETNRLALASEATLLSHDGAGHRIKVNKAAAGETGSLLFQTGWSGRAEMGLAGRLFPQGLRRWQRVADGADGRSRHGTAGLWRGVSPGHAACEGTDRGRHSFPL